MTAGPSGVIDASAALALVRREPEHLVVSGVLEGWMRDGRRLYVPAHFWLEVVNVLGRTSGVDGATVLESLHELDGLGLTTVEADRAMLLQALDAMERYRLTSYDAVYAALAESLDAELLTLDAALLRAMPHRAFRPGGSRRLSEASVAYEAEVTWPRYREVSSILARLRADAEAELAHR